MNQLVSFTPLMRQSVGFDRFNDLFESLLNESEDRSETAYPPYNIEKYGDDHYTITLAVAGFSDDDLNIVVENDRLSVSGRQEKRTEDTDAHYLHRGIATRAFERRFRLADHIKIDAAALKDGLLTIDLVRDVPEEKKPRMIPIKSGASLRGKKKAK